MVHSSAILSLGLAATALAAPTGMSARSRLAERNARRGNGRDRNSRVVQRVGYSTKEDSISTSTNWSGAVLESYSAEWQTVSGTITMPTPKAPSGGSASQTYSASAWVGIDGDSCQRALWQTGVDFNVKGDSVSFDAWWEWIPAGANDFSSSEISFNVGDTVSMSVTASSATTGTATIINESTGQQVSKTTTGSKPLCFQDAEWIVEDFEEGGGLVPLANWGTVTFSNATAVTSSGASQGPGSADLINLSHKGSIVTSASVTDDSVTVAYTGQ